MNPDPLAPYAIELGWAIDFATNLGPHCVWTDTAGTEHDLDNDSGYVVALNDAGDMRIVAALPDGWMLNEAVTLALADHEHHEEQP